MRTPTPLPFAIVLAALLATACGSSAATAVAAIAAIRAARSCHLELLRSS